MDISNIQKMIDHCTIQQVKQSNTAAKVFFKVPRIPQRSRVRLFGERGPFGVVVAVSDTGATARFKANDVIAFLEREKSRELSQQVDVAKKAIDATN